MSQNINDKSDKENVDWSEVYAIESPVEYEGNQILPPVNKIKSIIYFAEDLAVDSKAFDVKLPEVQELSKPTTKLQDKIDNLRSTSNDNDSNKPKLG